MDKIIEIIAFCEKHYDANTFAHAMRVACISTHLYSGENDGTIFISALCHDLLEDTSLTREDLVEQLYSPINLTNYIDCVDTIEELTRNKKEETYSEYIQRIKDIGCYTHARIIKIADLKDHLEQKDTLKESLKDRYIEALCNLL